MSDITYNSKTETNLSVEFVQREDFIDRVFALQKKYQEQWGGWYEFLQAYKVRESSIDPSNFELDEWAFLCEEFQPELFLREIHQDDNGPPKQSSVCSSQKPENDSGFCFGARKCLTRRSILRASNWR